MSLLFTPIKLRSLELKNRLIVAPMCQYQAIDGIAQNWHYVHYGSRAVGGAGLIIQEATAIRPDGRISLGDLGLWNEEQSTALKGITNFIHSQGCASGIQLNHSGMKGSMKVLDGRGGGRLKEKEGGWKTYCPSIPTDTELYEPSIVLDKTEIQNLVQSFGSAALRAKEAGFDMVEIHAAHGYLIHQFLSPFTNKRKDAYGGAFRGRIRFLLEIVEEVRSVWPDHLPLSVRISATDWADGGWTLEESVALFKELKTMGVDFADVSTGGIPGVTVNQIKPSWGYQLPFARRIKEQTGITTGAVGLIDSAVQSETILADGGCDMILIGRASLRDPYFPLHAAYELKEKTGWPVPYLRAV